MSIAVIPKKEVCFNAYLLFLFFDSCQEVLNIALVI